MSNRSSKFGKEFQRHLLGILVQNPQAASQLHQFLKPAFFDGARNKKAYRFIQQTWARKKTCPSKALFVESVADPQIARVIYNEDVTDASASITYAAEFAQTQAVKLVIYDWAGKVGAAEENREMLTQMVADVKEAVLTGQNVDNDKGEFFQRDLKKHLREVITPPAEHDPLASGLTHLDIHMRGGIQRGELHAVIGRTKIGKSTLLINILFGGLMPVNDARVAFFSLEMKKWQCRLKMFKRIALRNDDYIENMPRDFTRIVRKRAQALTGDYYLKAYPQRTMTASMLEADLDRLAADNFVPDIVIVDSGNIMKSESRSRETREQVAHNFTELRRITQERNMGGWTAAQANRPAFRKVTVSSDDVGETIEISQIVDSLWSLNSTENEMLAHKLRLVCAAGRRFGTGVSIDCHIDLDLGVFRTLGFTKRTVVDSDDGDATLLGYTKARRKKS